jgi:twitching motility two-component system response regulator PilG
MQGTLREIDITTIINLIELGQRTGELLIESNTGEVWFLFFDHGELIYATNADRNLTRLRDYLYGLGLESALNQLGNSKLGASVLEYEQIWTLLETQTLTTQQAKLILANTIKEVLFDILNLHQGTFIFEISASLMPKLVRFKFSQVSAEYSQQIKQWKQFYPAIQSINQCPMLISPEAVPNLSRWIDGKTTIRQLARYSELNICQVGLAIFNAIANGQISLTPIITDSPVPPKSQVQRILCIDDSITICRAVEYILHKHGFQVLAITSPTKALGLVFQNKPDLILCDITMPELSGYELCGMLRKSNAFAKVPIIMLTGQDGFIDRVKARMVGATEYLTKPFGEKELLTTVEKYSKR